MIWGKLITQTKKYTRWDSGFAGMNLSPIPAKKHSPSSSSVTSKELKRLGERKKII